MSLVQERLQLLALLPMAGVSLGISLLVTQVLSYVSVGVSALVTGWLVRGLQDATAGQLLAPSVRLPLLTLACVVAVTQSARALQLVITASVARRLDGRIRHQVREVALTPDGLGHLEDVGTRDDLRRAGDLGESGGRIRSPGAAAAGQSLLLARLVGAVVCAVILGWYAPYLAVFLLMAALTTRAIIRRQWLHLARVRDASTEETRLVEYWSWVASDLEAAKEIRLFGLGPWAAGRRRAAALAWIAPSGVERAKVFRRQVPVVALALLSAAALLGTLGWSSARGDLTIAELATSLVAAWGVLEISAMGFEAFDIEYGQVGMRAYERVRHQQDRQARTKRIDQRSTDAYSPKAPTICFEDVSFSYDGSDQKVFDGLTLSIAPGEVLGIVGVNGAGKTTLVKLLAGLHEPTSGRVTVDGIDLKDVRLASWRGQVTATMQEYIKYPLSLRSNVTLSAPEHADDEGGAIDALVQAGAGEWFASLPSGLDSELWGEGEESRGMSGGQWQRIAVARSLFAVAHGARVLVLDEPTAHQDARAEARFVERVLRAVPGISVLLISHRLASVREADRIVVLDGGRVAESGTHDYLLQHGGTYAGLFRSQAKAFASQARA